MKAVRALMLIFVVVLMVMVLFPVSVQAQAAGPGEASPMVDYSQEVLMGVAGLVITAIFSYAPKLRVKYAALSDGQKKGIMAGVLAIVTIGITVLSCTGWIQTSISCTKFGYERVFIDWVIMAIVNQTGYGLSPQMADVKKAKVKRDPAQDWVNQFGAGQ